MSSRGVGRLLAGFLRRPRRLPWKPASSVAGAGAGDPGVHAEEPTGDDAEAAAKAADAEQQAAERLIREGGERETAPPSTAHVRRSPFSSSLKLESSEVAPPPPDWPSMQQKRRVHGAEEVTCVGWDGSPLGGAAGQQPERRAEEEYKEYLEHHKPSPLSEIELADTRTPMRRATDSDAVEDDAGATEAPAAWKKEEGDGVEAALLAAEAQFRQAAERGDPDSPHGRVLASYHRSVV